MIYFNVAKTEQWTDVDWDSRLETETSDFETKTDTLEFEFRDVSRPRLESRELHL